MNSELCMFFFLYCIFILPKNSLISTIAEIVRMWYCCCKIAYYFALIAYHLLDVFSDWNEYIQEIHQDKFTGVSTDSSVVKYMLLTSFISGSACSLAIIIVYIYYICFHIECSVKPSYYLLPSVNFHENEVEICRHENGNQVRHCDRHFVLVELIISTIELYAKEGIQCVLLVVFASQNSSIRPEWPDILFAVCSAVGNSKLFICFITKFLGRGSGETKPACESVKWYCCVFNCFVSLVFETLLLVYALEAA